MRTGRSLTVFRSLLLPRGVGTCLVGGVPAWSGGGGVGNLVWGGAPGPGGCTCLVQGGVPGPWGVPAWSMEGGVPAWSGGGVPGPGGYLSGPGGMCLVRYSPLWTEWMTDRCKNITLAKTSFRSVKNCDWFTTQAVQCFSQYEIFVSNFQFDKTKSLFFSVTDYRQEPTWRGRTPCSGCWATHLYTHSCSRTSPDIPSNRKLRYSFRFRSRRFCLQRNVSTRDVSLSRTLHIVKQAKSLKMYSCKGPFTLSYFVY